ncbi:MAG TPA: PspC domain-containing protein [Polyangiaceae bacterium]|nr:PspC domain-containing protein [Polyangiaceae bacterium]
MTASTTLGPLWQVPRLRSDQRWLGGVAAAIAIEIGVAALPIRLAFVLLTLSQGIGLVLYASAWLWFTYHAQSRPGAAYVPVPKALTPARRQLGLLLVVCGLLVLSRRLFSFGAEDATLWPVALAGFGMLLAWSSGKMDWAAPYELLRAVGGLFLVAAGVVAFIALNFGASVAPKALLVATAALSLVVVVVAPWLWRAASQLGEERLKRTRADERAELAAHLHDSVLQTLSLIQRHADDRNTTVQLARRQERELREWLFGRSREGNAADAPTFRAALEQLGAEVEQLHQVPVEVVVVGDGALDSRASAALGAAREALVNAARHSGTPRIDVYGELSPERLEIFVRDTGRGFERASVPGDRRGLLESIVGRMERAGGSAQIHSAPGKGCEVALLLPRTLP